MKRFEARRQGRSTGRSASTTTTQTPGAPARVELHIEELVLHGFPSGDRFSISDAAQQELERLLVEQAPQGITHGPLNVNRVNAGSFNVKADARGSTIGTKVAQAIHRGLSDNTGRRGVTGKKL